MASEFISVFDIFKIGVGPSSSHTLGPWEAARDFTKVLGQKDLSGRLKSIQVDLYGSLAKTGKGHGTDLAVVWGLMGEDPVTCDIDKIQQKIQVIKEEGELVIKNSPIPFSFQDNIIFHFGESLPYHPNGLRFKALFTDGSAVAETYYSIGGGFIVREGADGEAKAQVQVPNPFNNAVELLDWCKQKGQSVSGIVMENEISQQPEGEVKGKLLQIFDTMSVAVFKGCHAEGSLPGGLGVARRAAGINRSLLQTDCYHEVGAWLEAIKKSDAGFRYVLDWVSCWALAVNEENAAFGRVVTAPTNGSAGVIPAVLLYNVVFNGKNQKRDIADFLLTASAVGSIFKKGATISAALGGCQAEIGVSSAMAASGLTEVLGGSPEQVLMAAEIAMEHHLGLTCDPIRGLVQIPCIERNVMGAIKAIAASQLALNSNPSAAKVSLDGIVKTMWEIAMNMDSKYKETGDGGLATNIAINVPEC